VSYTVYAPDTRFFTGPIDRKNDLFPARIANVGRFIVHDSCLLIHGQRKTVAIRSAADISAVNVSELRKWIALESIRDFF
jgi:hypothetical protein